jgi:hypothetical protein
MAGHQSDMGLRHRIAPTIQREAARSCGTAFRRLGAHQDGMLTVACPRWQLCRRDSAGEPTTQARTQGHQLPLPSSNRRLAGQRPQRRRHERRGVEHQPHEQPARQAGRQPQRRHASVGALRGARELAALFAASRRACAVLENQLLLCSLARGLAARAASQTIDERSRQCGRGHREAPRIDALQPLDNSCAQPPPRHVCAMTRGGGRALGTGFSVVISVGSASLSCPSSLAQVSPQQHAKYPSTPPARAALRTPSGAEVRARARAEQQRAQHSAASCGLGALNGTDPSDNGI